MDIGLESLLGCSVHDQKLKDVALLLEDKPRRSRRHREFDDAYYISFYRTGVSLLVDAKSEITCILIGTLPRLGSFYSPYPYELPRGLAANMSRDTVRSLLGMPSKFGGPGTSPTGAQCVHWDLWIFADHLLQVEYPKDARCISLVALMTPESAPEQQSRNAPIPTGSSALAMQPSVPVQWGLEATGDHQSKKQKVSVLIGNHDDSMISEVILHCVACCGEYEVVATSVRYAEEVVIRAQTQEFDLCIVVLNNLFYPTSPSSPEGFMENALKFITQLKHASQSPVIAFTGWPDDPSFGGKVVRAGANCFFWLPFPPADFMEAVKKCLSAH
jgi:hypothetical protein